ncbi:hypothetical protein KJS94_13100 [Flavihumibacter rivuli]|uniref:hypothetical protein n=1 Tax=Flavihumibacter rivuli TaxID=2838156 RepID=UPI001BDF4C81|nr:hypothetical protein [Flavihumibacter rivuli]ULQ55582.1 hypothetical protein KJS94_13100 [Flavihumibacter rivuli]
MNNRQIPLLPCLLMDAIGYFTYAIPFLGEFGDLVWAPVSALVFFRMFGGWKGALGGVFSLVEEILPFTDFIPTFTITWFIQYFNRRGSRPTLPARLT